MQGKVRAEDDYSDEHFSLTFFLRGTYFWTSSGEASGKNGGQGRRVKKDIWVKE